jgi:hypothetical protein
VDQQGCGVVGCAHGELVEHDKEWLDSEDLELHKALSSVVLDQNLL